MAEPASAKRAKIDGVRQHHENLVRCFKGQDASILWNTGARLQLVWPSLRSHQRDDLYFYIGRQQAQQLWAVVQKLEADCHRPMQIVGVKGSGKSTVMAAISGYLHGTATKRVVYVSGHHYASAPFSVLHEALMLSWCGQATEEQELWGIHDMAGLQRWCEWSNAYVVVDDWDKVEESSAKDDLVRACEGNMLIMISSVNIRERVAYNRSQKAGDYIRTFNFDGPYTAAELDTWISHSDLSAEKLASLDYYTGGMPGLASTFSESLDDGHYKNLISVSCRVHKEIASYLKKKEQVVAALELVTSHEGIILPLVLEGMKLGCFYKEGLLYHILCPYLRRLAEDAIVSEGMVIEKKKLLDDVQTWIAEVQADLDVPCGARNPARIGWNVEGLVIGVLRAQGQLLPGLPFTTYRTYAHGQEITALRALADHVLRGGVLLGPLACNENAVDLVYLILRGHKVTLVAVQITIAQWKAREKKQSHTTWKDEVLPKWTEGISYDLEQLFLYVMPRPHVDLEDVKEVEFRSFSQLSTRLGFLDGLDLEEPKTAWRKCRGVSHESRTAATVPSAPSVRSLAPATGTVTVT